MKKFAFLTGIGFLLVLLTTPICAFAAQSFLLRGRVAETKIVRGEKAVVELRLFFHPNVIPDLEKLKTENFGGLKLERIDFSSPMPFNRDYNHLLARLIFEMPKETGYGEKEIPAIPLEYRITDSDGKTLKVEKIRSEPLKVEIVVFRVKTEISREAVKVGEYLNYIITVVHQADVDIFAEKEKIETGDWKLLNLKLRKRIINGKTAKTTVNLLYGYYGVPKNSVLLPGPVIFIRQLHSDRLAEVKLDSKNIKILSVLTPQTEFREFSGLDVSFAKPPGQWTKNIVFGGTALLFLGGTVLLIRSLSVPLTTKIKIQPEKTRLLKKELRKILRQGLPLDEDEQRNYLIGLYRLIQRFLGAKNGLLKKEALATSAVRFDSLTKDLDRRALLGLEQIIWHKEKLQGEKWMEIKNDLERLIKEGGK